MAAQPKGFFPAQLGISHHSSSSKKEQLAGDIAHLQQTLLEIKRLQKLLTPVCPQNPRCVYADDIAIEKGIEEKFLTVANMYEKYTKDFFIDAHEDLKRRQKTLVLYLEGIKNGTQEYGLSLQDLLTHRATIAKKMQKKHKYKQEDVNAFLDFFFGQKN